MTVIPHSPKLAPAGPAGVGRANPWVIAIVATLGMSVSYIDRQTLAALAPSVCKALAIDNTHYGWLLSAFSMAYLAMAPVAGIVVDRLGARRGFAIAVLVWSVVAGLHAVAASFGVLFLLRVLLGTSEAPSFPAAAQTIRRALPDARRPLAVGLLFTGGSIGAVVAAKLALRLEAEWGFRGAFLGTTLIGLLWLPLWLLVTRDRALLAPPAAVEPPTGVPGARARAWRGLVTSGAVVRPVLAVVGCAPALMFVFNWTSKYFVDGWKLPSTAISNYLVVPPLFYDLGAVGFGALASLRERRRPGTPRTQKDLVIAATLLNATIALAPLTTSPGQAIAILALSAGGGGAIYALVTADMLARVPLQQTSSAAGMTAAAQSLSYVIAGPLVGWTIDRTHGYATALVALGLFVVAPGFLFVAFAPKPSGENG